MTIFENILLDFVQGVYGTDDPDKLFHVFEQAVTALGFDHLSYTFMPSVILSANTQYSPVFQLSKNYNTHFIEHYAEENFVDQDYTVKSILNKDLRVKNWWQDANAKHLSKQELSVIEVARHEYGIVNGLTIPTYGDGLSVGGVSVSSEDKPESFSKLYEERIEYLHKISLIYNDRLLGIPSVRILFEAPVLEKMTETEKSLIVLLSKGSNIQAIASELNLEYKYLANKVIPSIRKKMGGISRDKMMYTFGQMTLDKILQQ